MRAFRITSLLAFFIGCSLLYSQNIINLSDSTANMGNGSTSKRWPRVITVSNAVITIFQPQVESLKGNKLSSRAAVSIKRNNREDVDYCAIWTTATLDVNKDTRIVKMRDLEITKVAYPDTSEKVKESLGGIIRKNILRADFSISLDRLMTMMEAADERKEQYAEFDNSPPELFFTTEPSVLVYIDGDPVVRDINDVLAQVMNTNYLILKDKKSGKYYLQCAGRWFTAGDITGKWSVAGSVPADVKAMGGQENGTVESGLIPKIYIATKPAELIQSDGPPELGYIPGTKLSYLKNSDNDLFRDESNSKLYLLVSGRWFTADTKEGPWKYIPSDQLPDDFRRIPESSPKGNVLASIAGTEEAKDAVMESYIPQTATVKRGSVTLDIKYDGTPEFKKIDGTSMAYAVNTASQVIKLNDKYYACVNAVWYVSETPDAEDWTVCVDVPEEIYNIPPDNPLYNTTYVKVYDYDDDYADVGYTSGYLGSYPIYGSICFGTGYWYRWWCRNFRCPRPVTYGCRYRYNRIKSAWERYDRYRDNMGKYIAWNNKRLRSVEHHPALADGAYVRKRVATPSRNIYNSNNNIVRTAVAAKVAKNIMQQKAIATTGVRPAVHRNNNVYVGRDGAIYRHSLDGWQKRTNGNWHSLNAQVLNNLRRSGNVVKVSPNGRTPATTKPLPTRRPAVTKPVYKPAVRPNPVRTPTVRRDLNRAYQARQRGSYRTTRARSYSSRARAYSSRSVRGGGFRGGGRR